jgi:hypothetical protein
MNTFSNIETNQSLVRLDLSEINENKRYTAAIGMKGSRVKYLLHNVYKKYEELQKTTEESEKLKNVFVNVLKHSQIMEDEKYEAIRSFISDHTEHDVYIYWNTPENSVKDDFDSCMSECIQELEAYIKNYKPKENKKEEKQKESFNNYSFWFYKTDTFIGKLIGFEGSNIDILRDMLKRKNVSKSIKLKIFKSNNDVKSNTFKLQSDSDESDDLLCIKVSYKGKKNFKIVKECCQDYLNQMLNDTETDASNNDEDSVEPW